MGSRSSASYKRETSAAPTAPTYRDRIKVPLDSWMSMMNRVHREWGFLFGRALPYPRLLDGRSLPVMSQFPPPGWSHLLLQPHQYLPGPAPVQHPLKTEPPAVETEPPIVKTKPPVVETEPPVFAKTKAPIVKTEAHAPQSVKTALRPEDLAHLSQERFMEFFEEAMQIRRQKRAAVIDLISDDDRIPIKGEGSDIVSLESFPQQSAEARARSPRRGHARPRSPSLAHTAHPSPRPSTRSRPSITDTVLLSGDHRLGHRSAADARVRSPQRSNAPRHPRSRSPVPHRGSTRH